MKIRKHLLLITFFLLLVCSLFVTCKRSRPIETQLFRLIDHITEKNILQSPLKNILQKFNQIEQELTGQWQYFPSLSDGIQDIWVASSTGPILGLIDGKQPEGMVVTKNGRGLPFDTKGSPEIESWRWLQTKQKKIEIRTLKGFNFRHRGILIKEGQSFILDHILPAGFVNISFRIKKIECKDCTPHLTVSIDGKHVKGYSLDKPTGRIRVRKRVKIGSHKIKIHFQAPKNSRKISEENYIVLVSLVVKAQNDLILLSRPTSDDKSSPKEKFRAVYHSIYSEATQKIDPEAEKVSAIYKIKESYPIRDLGINENPYGVVKKARVHDHTFNSLYAPSGSLFRFDVRLLESCAFEFGYGFITETLRDSGMLMRFKVEVEHKGKRDVSFSVDFHATAKNLFETERIDLSPYQGKKISIFMSTEIVDQDFSKGGRGINPHSIWINPIITRTPDEKKSNVILISIDTLRADHLGCYGYNRPTSPAIDQFAEESVLFEKAISTTSWTLPAHVSMLTSLNSANHKTNNYLSTMVPNQITATDILRNNDIYCAAITGGGYLSFKYGFSKGFDLFQEIRHGGNKEVRLYEAEYIFQKSKQWLSQNDNKNFFLFIHTYQPHTPYENTSEIGKMFLNKDSKLKASDLEKRLQEVGRLNSPFTQAETQNFVDQYDGEIRYTDENLIKPLIDLLRELNLYDKTMIIITSDHGEEFMEHGNMLHGMSLYNEVVQVPLIVKFPQSQHKGIKIPNICSIIDIMPTVIQSIGLDSTLFNMDGKSLVSLIDGTEEGDRTFYCDLILNKLKVFSPSIYATNQGSMKLIWNKKVLTPYIQEIVTDFYGEKIELYDLHKDFWEKNNLAGNSDFEDLCKEFLDQISTYARSEGDSSILEMDEELEENLRALGYIK